MRTFKPLAFAIALGALAIATAAASLSHPARQHARLDGLPLELSKQTRDPTPHRPVIGLALGGGGLRGLAHVGVLQALEEAGIEPDIVVGTSAGALVGAAYASGKTADELEALALEARIPAFVDLTLSSGGLMRGDNIAEWVDGVTGRVPMEAFPMRFAAVATDLQRGMPVLLQSGGAGDAVRASASVPGVQIPVPYRNGHLVDGGVSSLVPVRAARALGADIVIAVDIYCHGNRASGLNAAAVLRQTMYTQSCLLAEQELAMADIRIEPEVAVPGISDKAEQRTAIRVGREAARKALARPDSSALLRRE